MASQKYAVGRPHIEEWLEGFESLADVTGDDLNELFVDKLGWKQDADEAKNKRNLIAWIRKHFPDKDVERLAVTNLVKTSMTTSRPASVAKTTVSPPAAPATRAAQPATSSSLPPPPRRNAVTTGGTDTADGGSDVAASSKPNKTPSPPKLINPVFPKNLPKSLRISMPNKSTVSAAASKKDQDKTQPVQHAINSTPPSAPCTVDNAAASSSASPPASAPSFFATPVTDSITVGLNPGFFHDLLLDAHVALNACEWDTSIMKLGEALTFAVLAKEKAREIVKARSDEVVIKNEPVEDSSEWVPKHRGGVENECGDLFMTDEDEAEFSDPDL